jgi:peptidoglycan/xylan/chitin deacetylase (PgdA/CDA1 family)
MPLRAKIRAAVKSIVLLGLFFGLLAGAIAGEGAARAAFTVATIGAALLGMLAAYIYIPGFDLFGRIPWRGRRGRGLVAITFDDGPNEPYTSQVLEALRRHGARATFFLLGQAVERHPETARRILAEGHAVGSHTFHHRKLHFLSPREIAREIDLGEAALQGAGVQSHRLFRAPHGLKSPFLLRILRQRNLRLVAWTDGVWDTDRPGAGVIAERALSKLRDGEILLLHDGKPGLNRAQTAEALEEILRACREQGLRCVTVPELLDETCAA